MASRHHRRPATMKLHALLLASLCVAAASFADRNPYARPTNQMPSQLATIASINPTGEKALCSAVPVNPSTIPAKNESAMFRIRFPRRDRSHVPLHQMVETFHPSPRCNTRYPRPNFLSYWRVRRRGHPMLFGLDARA